MADSIIEQLQLSAEKALHSQNINEGMQHLAKAFSLFSQEASRLKSAYANLQKEFQSVNKQLESVSLFLKSILKNSSQGILFINDEGVITIYNEAAEDILKLKADQVLFKHFKNLFSDDFFSFSMADTLTYSLSHSLRYITLKNFEHHTKEIEIFSNFLHEGPKEHQGVILFLRDITQLQQLQLIANRNDRMKELGEMAAAVAHEIRNPLGGIRGYATLLYRDLEGSEPLQEMAHNVIEGTKSLEKLVNNVLHYARPIQVHPKSTNLSQILRKLKKLIQIDPNCPENISVELHLSNKSLFVPVDEEAIQAALLNLIVNAYQAMQNGGKITLSLLKQDLQCTLTISDTGMGIEEEDLEKIFTPFFTTKSKGNGLGLSEAHKIVQAHNGSLNVYSQKDKGTTFTIILPLRK